MIACVSVLLLFCNISWFIYILHFCIRLLIFICIYVSRHILQFSFIMSLCVCVCVRVCVWGSVCMGVYVCVYVSVSVQHEVFLTLFCFIVAHSFLSLTWDKMQRRIFIGGKPPKSFKPRSNFLAKVTKI